MAEQPFMKAFEKAREMGTPLIGIQTVDQQGLIRNLSAVIGESPAISYDIVSGLKGLNKEGEEALTRACVSPQGQAKKPEMYTNAIEALSLARKLPENTVLFFLNAHRFMGTTGPAASDNVFYAGVSQAIGNLRDDYKSKGSSIILLGPGLVLPSELAQDVVILDEPLPGDAELKKIILKVYKDAREANPELKDPKPELLAKAIEAIRGLSGFAAETVTSLSLFKNGLDLPTMWTRKKKSIEQTPGLKLWGGKETFANVRGLSNLKSYVTEIFNGNEPPTVVVFMDEGEKMFAGSTGGDLSGVSQKMQGEFLSWTADNEIDGMIFVGHTGCSKSHIAKATGGEFGVPVIILSMSALEAGIVGQSGANLRNALKIILAIGRPLMMMTSNNLESLSPELKARFTFGTFMFDLPTSEERADIWQLYTNSWKLDLAKAKAEGTFPDDEDWTGREIKACCKIAYKLKSTLKRAAQFIVPVSRSQPEKIVELRDLAKGRFLSASNEGVYEYDPTSADRTKRKIKVLRMQEPGEA